MDARLQDDDPVSLRTQKADLPLYATRIKVYPRAVRGVWRRVKWAVLVLLLGLYYVVPWLRWDRGPDAPSQAILIDLGLLLEEFRGEYIRWRDWWEWVEGHLTDADREALWGLMDKLHLFEIVEVEVEG